MTRAIFRLLLVPAAACLVGGAGLPQDKKDDDKKDPQNKFEPRSKPGAGQEYLKKFVGDWDVDKTFHPKAGEPFKAKGTCRQTMVQDGRFLQSDFVFESAAGKTTGTGLIGWEPETGKFTSVWIDSRQTRMSFRQSDGKFDGEQIVLIGKLLGEGPKEDGRRSRTVSKVEDGGKRIAHRQFADTPDGKERLVMELVLTRKAEQPKPEK